MALKIRDDFDVFENKAVEISGCSEYAKDSKRKKRERLWLMNYVIFDTLKCQLGSRRQAYEKVSDIYGCIPTLYKTPSSVACILFSKLISTDKSVKSVLSMFKYIKTNELECMFPNLEICSNFNCSGERGFSILKRVNSYLRSTKKEERLNALAIFSIETELVEKLDFNDIINTFAHQKARKRKI
ncbi:hypothetical protein AGLY_007032 [Aphis glycines]|uniref:HAT C-terminal dimerisation domain-containing protein n=1 Tax=Aphis glycines TaxID=307491 RepID=A0A6G0TPG0_APHGL|nr:hypothetical protein AGLY_007032 [Aphis glycines]